MPELNEINFTHEKIRKAIHLCSLSIPIGYGLTDKEFALSIIVPITIVLVGADMLMKICPPLHRLVSKLFGKIMRPYELKKQVVLNGASWVMISACVCIMILPKLAAVTGFSVLIISDSSAAVFGRKFGKHKWFRNKSLEGSFAFMLSGLIVTGVIGYLISAPWQYFLSVGIATILTTLIEAVSGVLMIDDNLSIPLGMGVILLAEDLIFSSCWGCVICNLL